MDDGDTGSNAVAAAQTNGIALVPVAVAKRGFVLLRRRWVGERDFAWLSRFRQLARDQERLPRS